MRSFYQKLLWFVSSDQLRVVSLSIKQADCLTQLLLGGAPMFPPYGTPRGIKCQTVVSHADFWWIIPLVGWYTAVESDLGIALYYCHLSFFWCSVLISLFRSFTLILWWHSEHTGLVLFKEQGQTLDMTFGCLHCIRPWNAGITKPLRC